MGGLQCTQACDTGVAPTVKESTSATSTAPRNPLKIGATIPDYAVSTTHGDFNLHTWLKGDGSNPWTVLLSHPGDFTPVCTTELGECEIMVERFAKLRTKLIGISCDSVDEHRSWSKDILHRVQHQRQHHHGSGETDHHVVDPAADALSFPIIADSDRRIVKELGMIDPDEVDGKGDPLPARALVILFSTTVKLTILYPATTGRNFDEILRVLTSLQLTHNNGLATPVNWSYGERVIVGPPMSTAVAKEKYSDFHVEQLPSGKEYLRSVKCPPSAQQPPTTPTGASRTLGEGK
mmetsp:Transcript_54478/g.129856  ORF Transcript_54478/g.129856 Transcript_54478/m.129856 type:complete len:293 (+) Transcript_54478:104-982(+)